MTDKTILDSPEKIRAYIQRNRLDVVWTSWSSPAIFRDGDRGKESMTKGIRVNGYTPFYDQQIVDDYKKKICGRGGVKDRVTGQRINFESNCNGRYILPEDDFERRIIERFVCSKCGGASPTIFRIVNKYDRTRLWFDSSEKVIGYTSKEVKGGQNLRGSGRSFYATQTIHDSRILKPAIGFGWDNLKAVTLYIDIDLKEKHLGHHITDPICREKLKVAMEITEDVLSTFVPNSWNVQSSADGIYYQIHHLLSQKGAGGGGNNPSVKIGDLIRGFNRVCIYIDDLIKKNGITGVGVDPINKPGQLWKLVGSPHQRYDLVAIPLDWSSASRDIVKMNGGEFELKNFDINRYVNLKEGKIIVPVYNRFDLRESSGLYRYVEEIKEAASKKVSDLIRDKKISSKFDPDGQVLQKSVADLREVYGWSNIVVNLGGVDTLIDYKKVDKDRRLRIRSKGRLGIEQIKEIRKTIDR